MELGPRGAGREPRRLGLRWSDDNLDWIWGLDWTGLWTGLDPGLELTIWRDWTLDWIFDNGQWSARIGGCWISSLVTPAESGARTRRQESEPRDRRSWPAGVGLNEIGRHRCLVRQSRCQSGLDYRRSEGAPTTREVMCGRTANQTEKPNGPVPGGDGLNRSCNNGVNCHSCLLGLNCPAPPCLVTSQVGATDDAIR